MSSIEKLFDGRFFSTEIPIKKRTLRLFRETHDSCLDAMARSDVQVTGKDANGRDITSLRGNRYDYSYKIIPAARRLPAVYIECPKCGRETNLTKY